MREFRRATEADEVIYKVSISVGEDIQTGVEAVWEFWENEEGKRDRPFGPAFVATSVEHGTVFRQEWYENGFRHREDGPAVIVTDPETGELLDQRYYHNGDQYFPSLREKHKPGSGPGLT